MTNEKISVKTNVDGEVVGVSVYDIDGSQALFSDDELGSVLVSAEDECVAVSPRVMLAALPHLEALAKSVMKWVGEETNDE